jgi:hypothetical protein
MSHEQQASNYNGPCDDTTGVVVHPSASVLPVQGGMVQRSQNSYRPTRLLPVSKVGKREGIRRTCRLGRPPGIDPPLVGVAIMVPIGLRAWLLDMAHADGCYLSGWIRDMLHDLYDKWLAEQERLKGGASGTNGN